MAYRRPGIEVVQQFQALTPALVLPTLPVCIVGPAYQIQDDGDAGAYDGTQTDYSYPELYGGATVDIADLDSEEYAAIQKPISFKLSNAYVRIGTSTAGDTTANDQTFTDASGTPFANVPTSMGTTKYYVDITEVGHADLGKHLILSKTSDTEVELADEMTATASDVDFNVLKLTAEIEYESADFATVGCSKTTTALSLPATISSDPSSASGDPVVEADNVLVSYRAIRPDLADDLGVYTDLDSLEAVFGTGNVIPANPYAYGINVALNNTTTEVNGSGLRATFLTDEGASYQTALEYLESEDVYALVILTQSTSVHQTLSSHVTNQSASSVGRERIGFINRKLLTYTVEVPASGVGTVTSAGTGNGTSAAHVNTTFKDPTNGNFINDDVGVGYYLEISGYSAAEGQVRSIAQDAADTITAATKTFHLTNGAFTSADVGRTIRITGSGTTNDGDYTIVTVSAADEVIVAETCADEGTGFTAAVWELAPTTAQDTYIKNTRHYISAINSNTQLTLQTDPTNGFYGTLETVVYRITDDMSLTEEAAFLAGYSTSFANRRLVNVWPDEVVATVSGVSTSLPGYFAGCALGGLTAGLPSQQGFTNLSITGFVGRANSNDRYNDTQLDSIAGGGTLILNQDVAQAPLYVRHQLTTDTSTIQYQELSITKNVDLVARFFRTLYEPFMGKYNITDALLDLLKTITTGGISFLIDDTKAPRVGGVLRGGSISSIAEDSSQPDTVNIIIDISIPYPLNNIKVTLLV